MKKSKFTGEQTTFALRQAEVGTPVAEVCRKMDFTSLRSCSSTSMGGLHAFNDDGGRHATGGAHGDKAAL